MNIDKKRSIGDASQELGIPTHTLRYWENEFSKYIKVDRSKTKRRNYYNIEIEAFKTIKHYLYDEGLKIEGLKNLLESGKLNLIENKYKNQESNLSQTIETTKNIFFSNIDPTIKTDLMLFREKMLSFFELFKNI